MMLLQKKKLTIGRPWMKAVCQCRTRPLEVIQSAPNHQGKDFLCDTKALLANSHASMQGFYLWTESSFWSMKLPNSQSF